MSDNHQHVTGPESFPPIQEVPVDPEFLESQQRAGRKATHRAYQMGAISILITFEEGVGYHMSVAHHEQQYPSLAECIFLRQRLLPDDVDIALILRSEPQHGRINVLHFWQVRELSS